MLKRISANLALATMVMFSLVLLGACSGGEEKAASSSSAPAASGSTPAPAVDDMDKWNAYVDLSNNLHEGFYETIEAYFDAFGNGEAFVMGEESKPRSRFFQGFHYIGNLGTFIDEAAKVSQAAPQSELDKRAAELAVSLKPLWQALKDLDGYLKDKQYVEDDYAKANELHRIILAETPKVEAALPPFMDQLAEMEEAVREKSMKDMVEGGLKIRADMMRVLIKAEAIQLYFMDKGLSFENMMSLNLDEFKPLYSALSEAIKNLESTATEDQAQAESIHFNSVKDYIEVAKKARTQAAAMIEIVQNNNKPNHSSTQGTPESFYQQMDLLNSRYNSYIN